jgi:hypothetical protein
MLIVAGMGRNVGKTTFICRIISALTNTIPITAIKITPHFHELDTSMEILLQEPGLTIAEEKNSIRNKDSGKMLKAGALRVIYAQCLDENLPGFIHWLNNNINKDNWTIAESAALFPHIKPGAFILMGKTGAALKNQALKNNANKVIMDYNYNTNDIGTDKEGWIITG